MGFSLWHFSRRADNSLRNRKRSTFLPDAHMQQWLSYVVKVVNFCHRPSRFTPILGHTTHLNPVFGRTIQFEPRFEALVQCSGLTKKPKLSQFLGEKLSPKICFNYHGCE
jgi:hypothetical protein